MPDPLAGLDVAAALDEAGLNARGCLAPPDYDALVPPAWRCARLLPGAASALVLASGGRALFTAFRVSPEADGGRDPLDRYVRRVAEDAARRLAPGSVPLFYCERRRGRYADFVALARAAGLGAGSRLGLLLHPEYGPWLSIRAVLLTPRALVPTPALAGFDPCTGCPAPCAAACPGGAVPASGFDPRTCAATRRRLPDCRLKCDARRACVVGPQHAYTREAEAHHMRAVPLRLLPF